MGRRVVNRLAVSIAVLTVVVVACTGDDAAQPAPAQSAIAQPTVPTDLPVVPGTTPVPNDSTVPGVADFPQPAQMVPTPRPVAPSVIAPDPGVPSQSSEDAERDGVADRIAALPLAQRSESLGAVAVAGGEWRLSRLPAESLETPPGQIIYGELLYIDAGGEVGQAVPMPQAHPHWLHVTEDAIYAGHVHDGTPANITFVRMDATTLEPQIVTVGMDMSTANTFPKAWTWIDHRQIANRSRAQQLVSPVARPGTVEAAISWAGPQFFNPGDVDRFFDDVWGVAQIDDGSNQVVLGSAPGTPFTYLIQYEGASPQAKVGTIYVTDGETTKPAFADTSLRFREVAEFNVAAGGYVTWTVRYPHSHRLIGRIDDAGLILDGHQVPTDPESLYDAAIDPAFAVSSETELAIDRDDPLIDAIQLPNRSETPGRWFRGRSLAPEPRCGESTLYQEGADEYVRVFDLDVELEPVLEVQASDSFVVAPTGGAAVVRAVAFTTACPAAAEGQQLWWALDMLDFGEGALSYPPKLAPQLAFDKPVLAVHAVELRLVDPSEPSFGMRSVRIHVTLLDGSDAVVEVELDQSSQGPIVVSRISGGGWPAVAPGTLAPGGSRLELIECFFERPGRWRFTAEIDLPNNVDYATFHVGVGFAELTDMPRFPSTRVLVEAGASGSFDVVIDVDDFEYFAALPDAPQGVIGDTLCVMGEAGSGYDPELRSAVGPTSADVDGPRPGMNGRLLPGVNDPVPLEPDLVGWVELFAPGDGYRFEEVGRNGAMAILGSIGPAEIEIGGAGYDVPARTPTSYRCRMITGVAEGLASVPGQNPCLAFVGLDDSGIVEWILFAENVARAGDPSLVHGFGVIDLIGDDHAIVNRGLWLRLPISDDVMTDCSEVSPGELWRPYDLPRNFRNEAAVDSAGAIAILRCEEFFF